MESNKIIIKVPDIGDYKDVDVIDVAIKEGDYVKVDDTLITLETEKATMDVPSTSEGKVIKVFIKVGDKVSQDDPIIEITVENEVNVDSEKQDVKLEENILNKVNENNTNNNNNNNEVSSKVVVHVPDIGDYKDVDVIDVTIKEGDYVKVDDTLITLETEKATMDVPSIAEGKVNKVFIKVGDKVSKDTPIVELISSVVANKIANIQNDTTTNVSVSDDKKQSNNNQKEEKNSSIPVYGKTPIDDDNLALVYAGPAVRKLARELGVDLHLVKGSAKKGRIILDDVKNYVKGTLTKDNLKDGVKQLGGNLDLLPWPRVDFAKYGEIEYKELSKIKKISGQNLHRNWVMIPHVTQNDEADFTSLEDFRKTLNQKWAKENLKCSPLVFIIKAITATLKVFPEFNSSLLEDKLVIKKYINIGFAADTPNGLVVPVIKNANQKGLKEIATDLTVLSKKARDGKLLPQEMQGATFTISSLGGIGGTYFTPIINAPEVAILGVCKSQIKPKWNGKEFEPRLMCPLSLSYDHRVIDGAAACRFITYLSSVLEDFRISML